jgi:murein DD-endopeptidase MepM/ murein hydrolase activator NlpD
MRRKKGSKSGVSRAASAVLLLTSVYGCASIAGPQPTNCQRATYPDPATSPYLLPFEVGTQRYLSQSNCDGFHDELDWFAYDFDMPIGTTVLAARGGVVTWVQEEYEDGDHDFFHSNTVQITHPDGSFAQYLHLNRNGAIVYAGERVVQGQPIGISGFTGMTGPRRHLHFVVFEFLNADARKSLPVTFRNVSGPQPLRAGRSYRALPR